MSDTVAEVEKIVYAFAECWNRHDMDAFAGLFAPDAEFVNVVGLWWKGREEIKRAHELAHATMFKSSRLTISSISARFPRDDVAIARAQWVLEGHVSPEGTALPARAGILLNVLGRSASGWAIIDSQNTDIVEGVLSRPQ
ncbi:MAG TPA: SgcJ/EcaC family oxidoreductase [Povalibacter sp.]|nr:SgcJ/EcaC family oxidoreductase [Povalibacter sp.]